MMIIRQEGMQSRHVSFSLVLAWCPGDLGAEFSHHDKSSFLHADSVHLKTKRHEKNQRHFTLTDPNTGAGGRSAQKYAF